jgi:nitrous oxidase accessory protein NosD
VAGSDEIGRSVFTRRSRAIWLAVTAVVAAMTIALVPGTAAAAPMTLQVAAGGTDSGTCLTSACATIQYAVDQAAAGDTVNVGPGTYVENVAVHTGIALRGPESGVAADGGTRGAEAVIDGGAGRALTVSAAGVSVDGFTITGEGAGIYGTVAGGLQVENDIVRSSQGQGLTLTTGSERVVVQRNLIEGHAFGLIAAGGAYPELQISGNSIAVGDPSGYALFNSGVGSFPGLNLLDNSVHGMSDIGGNVEGGVVSGNRFDAGESELALQIDLHRSTLSGNSFEGNGTGGCLQLFGSQYNLDSSADATVAGNSFHGCDPYGIQLSPGLERITIAENTITDSYDGIDTRLLENETPWSVDGAQIGIIGNRIVGIDHRGIDNRVAGTLEASDNWWGCNDGPGLIGGNGCAPVSSGVQAAPWLVLTSSATESIHPDERATVRAAIDTDSSGAHVAVAPDGTPVNYSTDLGSLDVTTATTIRGATTTDLASVLAGIATVTATVDNQTVTSAVRVDARPTSPAASNPAPPPARPRLRLAGGGTPIRVSTAGAVTIASVACPEGDCRIAVQQRKVKVGGRGFPLELKLDKLLGEGESTAVTAVLPANARKALAAAGKAQAIVRLRSFSGSGTEEIPIRVRLKSPEPTR